MQRVQLLTVVNVVSKFALGDEKGSFDLFCEQIQDGHIIVDCVESGVMPTAPCRSNETCCWSTTNYFCLTWKNCSIPAAKSAYCQPAITTAATIISQQLSLSTTTVEIDQFNITTASKSTVESSTRPSRLSEIKSNCMTDLDYRLICDSICKEISISQRIWNCNKPVETLNCEKDEMCCSTLSSNICLNVLDTSNNSFVPHSNCYIPGDPEICTQLIGSVVSKTTTSGNRQTSSTVTKSVVTLENQNHTVSTMTSISTSKDTTTHLTATFATHSTTNLIGSTNYANASSDNITAVQSNRTGTQTTTIDYTGNINDSTENPLNLAKGMMTTTTTISSTTPKFSLDKYNKSDLANITIPKKSDPNRCSHGREFELFNSTCKCDAGWDGEICDLLRLFESVPMQISLAFESVGGGGVVITLALSVGICITSGDRHPQAFLGCSADFCSLAAQICILISPIVAGVSDWLCKFVAFSIYFATLSQLNFLLFQSLQAFSVTTYMVDRGFWPIGKFLTLAVGILLPFGWTSVSFTLNSEDFHPAWGCSINFHSKSRDFLIFPLFFTSWIIAIISESAGMISRRATKPLSTDPNEFLSGRSGLRSSLILAILSSSSILLSSAVLSDFNPIWVSWGFPINLAYSICIFIFHPFDHQKFRKFLVKYLKLCCCNSEVAASQPYSISFVDLTEMV